ncbi:Glycerol kinase [Serendipita sp. 396]|nr:Glycerol kinase [Serendipita sp. 396]KAG8837370.1 Glycerol kinase [Serendipita sp. 400]KAG8858025.1 Glycerol kinase [Serendipita sp. 411]KAG8871358.1 Glycerol kinase [Serendipita sp. 405]
MRKYFGLPLRLTSRLSSFTLFTSRTMSSKTSLKKGEFIGALDCGTTSTRFIIFDEYASIIAQHQLEFPQYYPHPGWHEHNPEEIIESVRACISGAVQNLESVGWDKESVKAIGITNQRETTVAWDRNTGKSLCPAIVWDDGRTKGTVAHYLSKLGSEGIRLPDGEVKKGKEGHNLIKSISGLPISTYFSAIKLRWMMHHHPPVQEAYDNDTLLFGTVDSWICYHLLGSVHLTDPSNASRTLLLDLEKLEWSKTLLDFFDLKSSILPKLLSSSEVYGEMKDTELKGVKVAGIAGDQQAALVGNKCLTTGEAKCTYGTGAFLLFCTGNKVVRSTHGLLSTVAYRPGPNLPPVYALEGSIAVAGSAIKWLRDQMKMIESTSQINDLAASVEDTGGVYFVTAFSGLLAPYWDPTAAGLLIGLSSYTTPGHIARATLEANAFQTRAILESMHKDAKHETKANELKVDGGMTNGDVAMQILADNIGVDILRPEMRESTALGSALLAGSAVGLYGWDLSKPNTFARVNAAGNSTFKSSINDDTRGERWRMWQRAIERAKGWDEDEAE